MHSRPKSSAEILATAKRASHKEIHPRKSKTERSQSLKDRLSRLNFSKHTPISDISSVGSSSSRPSNVHGLNNVQFMDPTTPQTLEAAVEIKDAARDVTVEDIPDVVGDEILNTRVPLIFLIHAINFHII